MGAKTAIKRLVPRGLWTKLFKLRHEVYGQWRDRQQTADRLEKVGSPGSPIAGPFKGMRYLNTATGSTFFPKILGTYELEIDAAIEWAIRYDADTIVDVGCAEGYYAVGFAYRCPASKVIAFDIESRARRLTHELAELNRLGDRVEIRRKCDRENLEQLLAASRRPLVIVDCEGYEDFLLEPTAVRSLSKAVVLVEVHDCFRPGLSQRLLDRFTPTHAVQQFHPRRRSVADLPGGTRLDEKTALLMMDEGRSQSSWMLIVPRSIATDLPSDQGSASEKLSA